MQANADALKQANGCVVRPSRSCECLLLAEWLVAAAPKCIALSGDRT